jgi:hypothetical protein
MGDAIIGQPLPKLALGLVQTATSCTKRDEDLSCEGRDSDERLTLGYIAWSLRANHPRSLPKSAIASSTRAARWSGDPVTNDPPRTALRGMPADSR